MTVIQAWRVVREYPTGRRNEYQSVTEHHLARPPGPSEDGRALSEPEPVAIELQRGAAVEAYAERTGEPPVACVMVPVPDAARTGVRRPIASLDAAIEQRYARVLPTIAVEIREWLARCGISQIDAARLLEPDELSFKNTLSRWTTGEQEPRHPGILRRALREIERELADQRHKQHV